jgi:hypothetical protein
MILGIFPGLFLFHLLMNPKLLPCIFFALFLTISPCRAGSKATVLDGHHLENTTVGFYGFAVDVPIDYEVYTPPTDKNFKPQTHPDLAWVLASRLDRNAGYHTTELFPFKNENRGLVVVVTASTLQIPPVIQEKQHLRFLDMFMSWAIKRNPGEFVRDMRKVGDTYVGRVGNLHEGTVIGSTFVLIPPTTILTFYGASPEADKNELMKDLDRMIATLNIGKRKLP